MAYKGVIEDFKAIRIKETPKRIPCVAISEEFDVKWHGKYTYEEFCQDGDKIFEVYKSAIEYFDYDWALVQIDDCFEFEPIGVGVKGKDNIVRGTYKYLSANRETLQGLPNMDPYNDGRMPEKLKAIKKLKDYFGDTIIVAGSCAAPFSAVGLMWGIDESMILMLTDDELLQQAMNYWKEFYKVYIKAQKDSGADTIWLGDCNAFSSMVSVNQYNEHIFPITKELVQYCENDLDITIWMHNSEILPKHVESHIPLGHSIESIGPDADIKDIRNATKGRIPISGNIDPIKVIWNGTPETIKSEVERVINICKDGGGYILNSGETIPSQTSEENMLALMRTAKKMAAY